MSDDDQYMTVGELEQVISLINYLDNARANADKNDLIVSFDTKVYDANGELLGAVRWNGSTGQHAFYTGG